MFFIQARRAPPVSYLGCLIIVLALALDPFAQQILQFQALKTAVPHLNSTVSRSQVYDWGTTRIYGASGNSECAFSTCRDFGINTFSILTSLKIKRPPMTLGSCLARCLASQETCLILHSHVQVLTALSQP